MQQTPYQFDQTNDGWRSLDAQGRYVEAAELILQFIELHRDNITTNPSLGTLYFHAGQEYATEGVDYYQAAIGCFEKAAKGDAVWDWYVKGTIAFLSKNSESLLIAMNEMRKIDAPNTDILERFSQALLRKDFSYKANY